MSATALLRRHAPAPARDFEVQAEPRFDWLSDEYARLFARSRATPFQSPFWLDRLYRHLAPDASAEPVVVTIRSRGGRELTAVLPLVATSRYGLRIIEFANLKVCDYVAPVYDEASLTALRDAGVPRAVRRALPGFDLFRIANLRSDRIATEALLGPVPTMAPMESRSHAVRLFGPAETWRRLSVDATTLKELDQKGRQLRRAGEVRLELLRDRSRITMAFQTMRALRRGRFEGREGEDLLQQPTTYGFYHDAATGDGATRTYALSVDTRPVAVCFGLTFRGTFLMLLMGFDQAAFKNRSVGLLLIDEVIKDCIARGDAVCDFTIGDEAYKAKFGAVPETLSEAWLPGSVIGSLALAAKQQLPWAGRMAQRLGAKRGAPIVRTGLSR